MQIDKKKIEKGLKKKGFKAETTHHTYFYFYYNGKQSSISTHTSHGSKYKVYGDTLLALMKKQLELDTPQDLADLIQCRLTEDKYIDILKSKGLLKAPESHA
mgnify:CR=1 FL=1